MDDLIKLLPLPKEIIYIIASYDRVLSIKRISKTDPRYKMLYLIPPKRTTFYNKNETMGWIVKFADRRHLLSMVLQAKSENICTYINREDYNRCELYLWE